MSRSTSKVNINKEKKVQLLADKSDHSSSDYDSDVTANATNKNVKKRSQPISINLTKELVKSPVSKTLIKGEDIVDTDVDDEIFIQANFEEVNVPMLFDQGAHKSLLPANLFESSNQKKRFKSASGHSISSSGAKRFYLIVNKHIIPITAYVTEGDLAIIGRPFTKKCSVVSNGEFVQSITYNDKGKSKNGLSKPK